MKRATVSVITHGCKLNQFEGEALAGRFQRDGFALIDAKHRVPADVTVVNTCTVTSKSDRKCRQSILRAARLKPKGGLLIVTGCYAQTDAKMLAGIEGVDRVIGISEKAMIPRIVRSLMEGRSSRGLSPARESTSSGTPVGAVDPAFLFEDPAEPRRSRAFVKVQDGCGASCAYCKVPIARGSSRSRDYRDVVSYVERVTACGFEEVVLTGVDLGDYRFEGKRLADLLELLLSIPGNSRIRLSSMEPMHFSEDLFGILANPRIAPHFHVPLQSGSDGVLARMGRPYDAARYVEIARRLRELRPGCHVATDVIVGFCGESGEDFEKTVRIAARIRFASMHVFTYSPRKGTRAAAFPDDVSARDKERRRTRLIGMRDRLNYLYRKGFLGAVREAVVEKESRPRGEIKALTDNYIRVRVRQYAASVSGRVRVRILAVTPGSTLGEICP